MSFNNMPKVAAIFGKLLNERFKINGHDKWFSFESCGLVQWEGKYSRGLAIMDCYLVQLLTGELVIAKESEQV